MKKRLISFTLCISVLFALFLETAFAIEKPSVWAEEYVNTAIATNLVPKTFLSQYTQATTRAEFCALAVMLYETVTGTTITDRKTFDDTDDVNVEKCAAIGVVNGTNIEGTIFSPNIQLTREQAATIIVRLGDVIGRPLSKKTATFYDNGDISSWAIDAVGQMQRTHIMEGIGNNMFAPKELYTREQSIITILRLYNYITLQIDAPILYVDVNLDNIQLSWTPVVDTLHYIIYIDDKLFFDDSLEDELHYRVYDTNHTITGLSTDRSYTIKVLASLDKYDGMYSNTIVTKATINLDTSKDSISNFVESDYPVIKEEINDSNTKIVTLNKTPTKDNIQLFLKNNYSVIETSLGDFNCTFEILENFSTELPYDYRIESNTEAIYEYGVRLRDDFRYTIDQKEEFINDLKKHQEKIGITLVNAYPSVKFEGCFFNEGYKYPYLKIDYSSSRYFFWNNYDDELGTGSIFRKYNTTNASVFRFDEWADNELTVPDQ